MKKRNLSDWAAIAEIIGTTAVVVSLLFVAYSVNRNTVALQAVNENFFFQMNDGIIGDLLSDSDILTIVDKRSRGEELSNVENMSMWVFTLRQFNIWKMAYDRYRDGLYAPDRWLSVNKGYANGLINGFSACDEVCWSRVKLGFAGDFVEHVDAEYTKK